ncbi:MAG: 6-carboxytetrahydropterin synthase [Bacteroidota bacterium]|nr:6-carboxytetrahydropterin synthase [Bacteroidota bacterium]
MVYLTRRERFNAAHRLFREDWDNEKNMEVFGKCSNPNWHGHNYDLYVTVKGEVNPELGFVINLKTLGRIICDEIIEKLDHKNLNTEVAFLSGKIMSTENIVIGIWDELEPQIKNLGCELHCVKLVETENNYVEFYGH